MSGEWRKTEEAAKFAGGLLARACGIDVDKFVADDDQAEEPPTRTETPDSKRARASEGGGGGKGQCPAKSRTGWHCMRAVGHDPPCVFPEESEE